MSSLDVVIISILVFTKCVAVEADCAKSHISWNSQSSVRVFLVSYELCTTGCIFIDADIQDNVAEYHPQ